MASIKLAAVKACDSIPCLETLPLTALSLLQKNVLDKYANKRKLDYIRPRIIYTFVYLMVVLDV